MAGSGGPMNGKPTKTAGPWFSSTASTILLLISVAMPILSMASPSLDRAELQQRLDAYIAPYVAAGQFSGVVLFGNADGVLVLKPYGYRDYSKKLPTLVSTRYRIASVSKTFTGAAIIKLAQEHRLEFSDAYAKFNPEFPNGDHITLDELLRHTSGVGVFQSKDTFDTVLPLSRLVHEVSVAPPLFAPGTASEYSNEGYVLLADVIEKSSAMPYSKYLEASFLKPLAMKNTNVETGDALSTVAKGTRAQIGLDPAPLENNEAIVVGASGMYADAADLFVWLRAVASGKFIDLKPLPYPYGWGKRNYSGHPLIEQSGSVEGYASYIGFYEEGIFVVSLSNVQSGMQGRVGPDFASVLFGGSTSTPPKLKPSDALDEHDLAKLVGEYKAADIGYPLRLRSAHGRLEQTWGAFPFWRPVTAVSRDRLIVAADYTLFDIVRDDAGNTVSLRMGPIPVNDDALPGQATELVRIK